MTRRAKRFGGRKFERDKERSYAATVRTCCPTNRNRPHDSDCKRHPTRCRDKVAFPSRDRAMARAALHSEDAEGGLMTAYRCDSCDQWHIGHPAPDQRDG